jgi:hypothetical protein
MIASWDRFNNGFDRETKPKDDSATNERAASRLKEFQYMAGLRGNWNTHWTEIAQRIWPMHANLFNVMGTTTPQGDKRNQQVYDSTGILALSRFGAILDSLLTPRDQFWHYMTASDPMLMRDKATRLWFSKVNEILFKRRYAATANFSSQNQLVYKSLGAYGTGCLLVDDLAGTPGLRYRNIHLSECYLRENHQGVVDGVDRYFRLTARQALQMFGSSCPEDISSIAKDFPEREFFFLHVVAPREDRDPERKDFKGMKYVSEYISITGARMVAEGGYHTFPYGVPRYEQAPNEPYGRSPAMDVLPSIKTLNEQKKAMLKQGQRVLDPILLVHDDGILDSFNMVSGATVPGGISPEGRALVQPLPTGNIQAGEEMMNEEKNLINDTFLVTIFKLLEETREMTATEVIERTREKAILLAPTIGRQQSEYLGPVIDRELDILSRQGLLPAQPPLLKSARGEYKITYDSPISRTQKSEWAAGAVRTVEVLLNYATQAQDPSVLDVIDMDKAAPQIAEIYGTPADWIRDQKDIAQIRQQRQKQMELQTAIQAAPAAAGIMKAQQGAG